MNKVLFVLHQKTSVPGDVGNKFRDRGYVAEICRPPLDEQLPSNINKYSAIVVFGAPGSINDEDEYTSKELEWINRVIKNLGAVKIWKVNIKPGRPFGFGLINNKTPILMLPGNPVASFTTFNLFGKYLINHLIGNINYNHI